ncbi:MAG TPA: hypothetical protein VFE37_18870 [Chloroflexota bacterium]|nr:hypothetical protein [Chloroflexota bacterium]
MSVSRRLTWQVVTALALALTGLLPAARAQADDQATTMIQLESPASDTPSSTRLMVSGWAADPTGDGAGVDAVRVYLGDPNADGQDLGAATYGQPRPDVARTLGDSRFTNSGFQLAVELPAGDYTLTIYAHRNTASQDEGWVVYSTSFTASASVRPDPRAVALLGGDQPPVRTANPSNNGAIIAGNGSRTATGDTPWSASTPDGTQIRTTVTNSNDPIPLDPIIPGATSTYSPGRNDAELADPTGSGSNIRISVASDTMPGRNGNGQYSTGSVTLTGGQGNSCPGPNCPANTQNMNQQLQNMPPDMLRQLTGYNIPGFGNSTPCIPTNQANAPNACNPATGSSLAPGAPNGIQQLQAQTAAAQQAAANQPVFSPVGGTGPQCMLTGANGQCATPAGSAGPLGSTCLRFVGQQCAYYGQPPATAGAAPGQAPNGLAPQAGLAGQPGLGATNPLQTAGLANSGCAQWGGSGQCLQPASAAGTGLLPGSVGLTNPASGAAAVTNLVQQQASVPLTSTGQSSLYQPTTSTTGQSSLYQTAAGATGQSSLYQTANTAGQSSIYQTATTAVAGATNPYSSAPAATSSSGICLQFGAGGACVRSQ